MNGTSGAGVVLASYGRGVLAQADDGAMIRCVLRSRKQRFVCGDRVHWRSGPADRVPSVEALDARRNLLERIDARGRAEPIASNLDQLAIMVACEPLPDWFLVDRYWAAAQLIDLPALLLVNKIDIGRSNLDAELAVYRGLGLPCHEISTRNGAGLAGLRAALVGGVTLLAGQSGVGKSSLVNALVPQAAAEIAALTRDEEGRHTTTAAHRYALADARAGAIIDAPGVRDFAPPATLDRAAERGYIEINVLAADCRFNDCRHLEEPGCAVRAGVSSGAVTARRYESYRRLFRLYQKLAE